MALPLPTADWQIAVGHDQSSLDRWNTITDTNSVPMLDPGDPPPWATVIDGEERIREDLSIASIGFPSHEWHIPFMTVEQYDHIIDNYNRRLVTIKDILDGIAFAFYNATFRIEQKNELVDRWNFFSSSVFGATNFAGGWGWSDVIITFTGVSVRP